jgi:hypothetical protein
VDLVGTRADPAFAHSGPGGGRYQMGFVQKKNKKIKHLR